MTGNALGWGHRGLGLGIYGTLKTLGKVAGPLVAGALLEFMDYEALFVGLAALAFASSLGVLLAHRRQRPAAVENERGGCRDTPRGGSRRVPRQPDRPRPPYPRHACACHGYDTPLHPRYLRRRSDTGALPPA